MRVNIGVLAVAEALASAEITAGLGLGLFGVLSIIRLRSFELDQQEVAYYFVVPCPRCARRGAGRSGLVGTGVDGRLARGSVRRGPPRLFARYRTQSVNLDVAYSDETALIERLEDMLGAHVHPGQRAGV